jgi:hypothetical protein
VEAGGSGIQSHFGLHSETLSQEKGKEGGEGGKEEEIR